MKRGTLARWLRAGSLVVWVLSSALVPHADETKPPNEETRQTKDTETQEKAPPVQPYFIGEVVVSADDDSTPGTIDSLEPVDIEAAGVVTAAEALELLPGVSMSTTGRNEQKIWVRGYEQSNVLILVDGVPMADPYYGELDLGQIPVFDVARISVTRGGASPLYGPNGLGGVVNIVTFQGGAESRVAGRLRFTENRTGLVHASAGGGNDRLSWYVGLGYESSDGWDLSSDFEPTEYEDGGTRVNSDFERGSALARVGFQIDDSSSLFASLRFVDSEKGIPFHTSQPRGFVKFARFPTWQQGTLGLGYERGLTKGGEFRAQLYGLGFENTLDVYGDPDLQNKWLESSFNDRTYGGYALLGQLPIARSHRLSAALHLRKDHHKKTESYPDGSTDPSERYGAWTSSFSVEDRWNIGSRTSLVISAAMDTLRVDEALTLRDTDNGAELVEDPQPNETLVSPQIELQTSFGAGWSGSAAVYRRSRFPTMRQLYGTEPPNPELRPQRNTGIDLGLVLESGPMAVRGNVFFDTVDDLISRQGRDFPYENQDEAEIKGIELRYDARFPWLDLGLSWTGLDHEFTSSSEGMEEFPYVPNSQAELLAVFPIGERFDIRGTWIATGRRYFYDWGEKKSLEGYDLVNLGFSARFGATEFSLYADNIFDDNVEQEDGYPLPGRRIWAGIHVSFNP